MSQVPYLYINLTALCCYAFIFVTFLAARKTAEIRAFIVVMVGFIFWTGGSILMRLQVFPGVDFWFMVSILSLFVLALLIYFFVASFARLRGYFLKLVLVVGTLVLEVLTAAGLILAPPTMLTQPDGGVVFTYTIGWPVLVPFAYFAFYIVAMCLVFRSIIREKGVRTPGLIHIICGCVAVLLGNALQLIPGNVFPWDTLSGIVFALLLMWALYKKRMFQMSLLISRSALTVIFLLLFIAVSSYFIAPAHIFLTERFGIDPTTVTSVIVVLLALLLFALAFLLKKLVDALFTREEHQGRLLKGFSAAVSQTLNTGDIMAKLIAIIREEVPVRRVYVCLPREGRFVAAYSSEPLAKLRFSLAADSPCVRYLREREPYFLIEDLRRDPLYLSAWREERELFSQISPAAVFALRDGDEIVGLALLSGKEKGARYTYTELSYLETVCSIASIAVKNAGLYEQMYREARVDSLTGAYNYRYFVERVNAEFEACRGDCLALMYIDVDDFRLYNQLYGAPEGDRTLRQLAELITLAAGGGGTAFRYSGKVFAVLLPHCDARQAEQLAYDIRARVARMNQAPERAAFKPVSVSCGICVAPYAASSPKELVENADLAVYNAKGSGKDSVFVFLGNEPVSQRASDRALAIIQNSALHSDAYKTNTVAISALTAAIDAKDHYTYQHSRNVAFYAAVLATAAGMNPEQVAVVYEAGLLHDIGKISIPENILSKNGRLDEREYEVIRGHVNSAIDMIRHLPAMDYVIPAAIGHHERWDGQGYPRGLAGTDIPQAARCLAVADAFDAMTTDRPYHAGLTFESAAREIERGAGSQFDPELAAIFVHLVRSGEIGPQMAGASIKE